MVIVLLIAFILLYYHKKGRGGEGAVEQNDKILMCHGGGFHAFWYSLGMASVLEKRMDTLIGYSSGAMVACLICSLQSTICFDTVMLAALETKYEIDVSIGRLHYVVRHFLNKLLPEDAHIRCSGRCGVILCDPKKLFHSRIINSWDSREDLINCIVASTYVPFLVGPCLVDPHYSCIDGALCVDLKSISNSILSTRSFRYHLVER